ncbi:patatin-like phospholipase family protein [Pseudonocardia sp. N23]|uniref:patatin-like phospholipase family protein n=1 Tax=Pseudonocardia sp. N23 TaxID=1987376 RepID=UPI000BFDA6F2|nr:patatin-like phospholipase family protein [Pseudonocardia sp. N23]GAY09769.1 cholesterol oxidase [Pseudonocardia sp. N23]
MVDAMRDVGFADCEPGGILAPDLGADARRGLVMAGGGLKVAHQAGVLQVWLDEARIDGAPVEFVHVDGASGGVFNLAMWCQGMSGRAIADNWRRFAPLTRGAAPSLTGTALFSMRRFRTNVLQGVWGLDWPTIRARGAPATFNVFDVDAQRSRALPPAAMSEDLLVAATSLPGWYPPVVTGGRRYIDAVYVTDANLSATIGAGANELWIPWTVSMAGSRGNGPVSQYFQIIEAAANGRLHADLERIAASNAAWAAGGHGSYPHPVRVVPLVAEVPIHYLLVFTRRSIAKAVEQGVRDARRWCADRRIGLGPPAPPTPPPHGVRFRERMAGRVRTSTSPATPLAVVLTATVRDVDTLRAGDRRVTLSGHVDGAAFGGRRPVETGELTLLPGDGPSTMEYRLDFTDGVGHPLTLVGVKTVRHDGRLDLWPDTATLVVTVRRRGEPDDVTTDPVADGTLRLRAWSFLRLLTTMRGIAPGLGRRTAAVWRFASWFLRRLAAVYLRPRELADDPGFPAGEGPTGACVVTDNRVLLPVPPERAWELLVDAAGWPRFYDNARRIDLGGDKTLAEGTTFRWTTFRTPVRSTVVRCEYGVELGWTWRGPLSRGYHVWWLTPDRDGCRVRTVETQRGPVPWLARVLLRRVVTAGHDRWLRGLLVAASAAPGATPRVSSDPRGPGPP